MASKRDHLGFGRHKTESNAAGLMAVAWEDALAPSPQITAGPYHRMKAFEFKWK